MEQIGLRRRLHAEEVFIAEPARSTLRQLRNE